MSSEATRNYRWYFFGAENPREGHLRVAPALTPSETRRIRAIIRATLAEANDDFEAICESTRGVGERRRRGLAAVEGEGQVA